MTMKMRLLATFVACGAAACSSGSVGRLTPSGRVDPTRVPRQTRSIVRKEERITAYVRGKSGMAVYWCGLEESSSTIPATSWGYRAAYVIARVPPEE